jgi:hypothetical protein
MNQTITLKHGEIKTLRFTYKHEGSLLSIESATLTFTLKKEMTDVSPALEIEDASFSKSENVATVVIDTSSLDEDTKYFAEIKAEFSADSLDKSDTFYVDIKKAVDGD